MAMKESKAVTKDPICEMTVDEATALHAERDDVLLLQRLGKGFCRRPPVLSRRTSLEADVDNSRTL